MTNPKESVQAIFLRDEMQLINEGVDFQGGENDGTTTIDGGDDGKVKIRNEETIQK